MKNFFLSNWSFVSASVLLIVLNSCQFSSTVEWLATSRNLPKCVYVKNVHFNEYLYMESADVAPNPKDSRGPVFTWRNKQDGSAADWGNTRGEEYRYQGVWKLIWQTHCDCYLATSAYHLATNAPRHIFVEHRSGSPDRHRIAVNIDHEDLYDSYIYASPDFEKENSKSVFNMLDQLRITVHLGDQSQQYVISSTSDSNRSHRRNVTVWGPSEQEKIDTMGDMRDWIIEKAECPPFGFTGSKQTKSPTPTENSPASVRSSQSKCVYLKNIRYDEFLYAQDPLIGRDFLNARIWSNKTDDPRNWGKTRGIEYKYQAVFQLEKNNSSCRECLAIKSVYYKKLFYFTKLGSDHVTIVHKKTRFTDLGQNIWELETIAGSLNHIRLKNKNPGDKNFQYLIADKDVKYKRDVNNRKVSMADKESFGSIDSWIGAADWIMLDAECPSYIL